MVTVNVQLRGMKAIGTELARIKDLNKLRVYVGIQEPNNARTDSDVTNSQLLYIHSFGSPVRNIPPRPVIEPAINAYADEIRPELKAAAQNWLGGRRAATMQNLRNAGKIGRDAARGWFYDSRNNWPPNAPSTIARKGFDQPLIETEQLRKSISYVLGGL